MRRLFAALALVTFVLAAPRVAAAEEFISAYHSVIELAKDGTLTVTETITANVEGNRIRRGIYRDFPVSKGCTSPFAPIWITEMVKRQTAVS